MSDNKTTVNYNPGWLGLLGVLLVFGKLMNWFEITWFWATAPFWLGIAIVSGILVLTLVGGAVSTIILEVINYIKNIFRRK